MLVLTRKITQSVIVNENIKFVILGINGNQVRVGIEAPKEMGVDRQEIFERKQLENINKTELSQ